MPAITKALQHSDVRPSTMRNVRNLFITIPFGSRAPCDRSWLVVAVGISRSSGIRRFVRIDWSEPGFLQFRVERWNILLPDFRPPDDELLQIFLELSEDSSGLRRGRGIGAV